MISVSNADKINKELQEYADDVERKMKAMVAGFAGDMVEAASSNTKVVDLDMITDGGKLRGLYERRLDRLGIDIAPGYHAGAWKYVDNQLVFDNPIIRSSSEAQSDAINDAKAQYTLGQTFSIGMTGPAATYAGPDFSTVEPIILAAYKSNIKRYFDKG